LLSPCNLFDSKHLVLGAFENDPEIGAHLDKCEPCRKLATAVLDALANPKGISDVAELKRGSILGEAIVLGRSDHGLLPRLVIQYEGSTRLQSATVLHSLTPESLAALLKKQLLLDGLWHPAFLPTQLTVEAGFVLMVCEYVGGTPLFDADARKLLPRLLKIGEALGEAHAVGAHPGYLGPESLVLAGADAPLLLDYGYAEACGLAKKARYAAPEVLEGKNADALSDQFAFCMTIIEALCRVLCPTSNVPEELRAGIAAGNRVEVCVNVPGLPGELLQALNRGLERDPARRFPSMKELLASISGNCLLLNAALLEEVSPAERLRGTEIEYERVAHSPKGPYRRGPLRPRVFGNRRDGEWLGLEVSEETPEVADYIAILLFLGVSRQDWNAVWLAASEAERECILGFLAQMASAASVFLDLFTFAGDDELRRRVIVERLMPFVAWWKAKQGMRASYEKDFRIELRLRLARNARPALKKLIRQIECDQEEHIKQIKREEGKTKCPPEWWAARSDEVNRCLNEHFLPSVCTPSLVKDELLNDLVQQLLAKAARVSEETLARGHVRTARRKRRYATEGR
jgi:hypothetical protein